MPFLFMLQKPSKTFQLIVANENTSHLLLRCFHCTHRYARLFKSVYNDNRLN